MEEKAMKSAPVMIHVVGPDGLIAMVNKFWLETMGYEEDEVIGKRPEEFIEGAEIPQVEEKEEDKENEEGGEEEKKSIFKELPAREEQLNFSKKNGEIISLTYNNFPLFDYGQNFKCSFAALTTRAGIGTMVYDMVLGKGSWSTTVYTLTGAKQEEEDVYFANHCSIIHPDDVSDFEDVFITPTDDPIELHYRMRREGGGYFTVHWWGQQIIYENGENISRMLVSSVVDDAGA